MTTRPWVAMFAAVSLIAGGARAQSAAPAPPATAELPPPPAPPAPETPPYDQRFIGFDDYGFLDPDTGSVHKVTELYEGKYKRPLAALDFYRLVGRADLAQEYQRRDQRRSLMMGAGSVIIVGSVVAAAAVGFGGQPGLCPPGTDFATFNACASRNSDQARSADLTAAAIGVGGVLLGGALVLAGAATDPNPIGLVQMRQLADEYNQKLKHETSLRVVPLATPDQAGLALDLRF